MKLVFITNYLTHHQLPFCEELYKRLGAEFVFLYTTPMEQERRQMGWELCVEQYPYVHFYDTDYERSKRWLRESDVVICGGTHYSYIQERILLGKLTFHYFERLYKKGWWEVLQPRGYYRKWQEHTKYAKNPVYLLCAGAYVAKDFAAFGAYKGKAFRWGYFPKTKKYDLEMLFANKKEASLLWTGRMLDWKHPETAVEIARILAQKGKRFHLTMVGEGPMRGEVEQRIQRYDLASYVEIKNFMSPEEVREHMEKSWIYLMTSDRQEGWGAVVNEAMNSGCVVLGAKECGSVPYLLSTGETGYVISGNQPVAYAEEILALLQSDAKLRSVGEKAYRYITEQWNEAVAAERILELSEHLLKLSPEQLGKNLSAARQCIFYESGILSAAEK